MSELSQAPLSSRGVTIAAPTRSLCAACTDTVALVVHDFKTPLTALRLSAQLLQRHLSAHEPAYEERMSYLVQNIVTLSQSLHYLADDLLALALPRSFQTIPATYDVIAVLRQLVSHYHLVSAEHQMQITTTLESLPVAWSQAHVERIITNLLTNACKYSPPQSRVLLTIDREDVEGQTACAVINIIDEGIGIPTADLPTIFERGRRGSNVATMITGTGFGLSNVQALIASMNGDITITSQEHAGTQVTVRLPLDH